jgi:glycosyltransferase involved in cell wall biosynthesis
LRIRARRAGQYRGFLEVGQRFSIQVREALKKHSELKSESILFGYDTGALEVMEWGRERGMKCVLDQMDPSRVEADLVREEEERWPGWAQLSRNIPEEFFNRREKEWALADRVVVNSEFCREALLKQGVAAEKLVVVPLCYEPVVTGQRPVVRGPLRVLFLGQVVLRKGIQYLIEAARKLETESVCFDVVGPIGISQAAIASAPSNVHFCGRTSRNEAADWYQAADVFVLPTISDGFAITQLEAMAYGLPVIATPCCGAVVSHDVDGLIVPPRAPDALANAIQRYLDEPELLKGHGAAALVKSKQFSLERLVANLLKLEAELNRN